MSHVQKLFVDTVYFSAWKTVSFFLSFFFWLRFSFIYDLTSSCMLIFIFHYSPTKSHFSHIWLFFFFSDARTWHVWVPTCTFLCAELEGCAVKLVTWSYSLFVADKSREWRDYWILQENVKVGNVTSLSILVPRTYLSSRIFNYIGYTFLCGRFS